ncbi:MAG TPA: trigger factor [Myxococcaceae bacterium]|nr:trigger factor [Myxococcaceae bacterium]
MKVSVQEVSPIERKLSIEVESARVAEELSRAYTALGRRVKIAGFRPGKIPRRILEQRFRAEVEQDVTQRVVEKAYLDAVREHQVEAVSNPVVSGAKVTQDGPLTFEARVQVKPAIDPKDYRELPLKRREVKVEESEVNEQLERMRQRLAHMEDVQGRDAAESGDYAIVDYEATVDEKPFPGSKAEGVTVEVAQGEVAEGKIAALAGVKIGERKVVEYAFPPDYGMEELKGKVARFDVLVKGLKRSATPELNDDFAKEMNGGDTLDAFKAKIRTDLEKAAKRKNEGEAREELIAALAERNPFEVPEAMIERTANFMIEGALRSFSRSGVDIRQLNLDVRKLQEEMRPKAVTEVKGTLLFEAVAAKEKIEVSEEDLERKIEALAEEAGQPVAQVKRVYRTEDQRRGLQFQLREEKTIEFLRSHAKYS